MEIENKFAQRITSLRTKRGISQKAAAQELGISQGLLSHYEKGIRECGLDFVIKAAEFYSVSCGYLLGVEKDSDEQTSSGETKLNKRGSRVVNGVFSINEISTKIGGETLCNRVNDILAVQVYNTLRMLDKANRTGAFDMDLSRSLITSSAFIQNAVARLSGVDTADLPKNFELSKDTAKLIKNVEQKLDVM